MKKSNKRFSAIGIDHAHEQNNKILKVDGGLVDILDNEEALDGYMGNQWIVHCSYD